MKLSDTQRLLIARLEFEADLPVSHLAKELGIRESTANYHIRSLRDRGVITQHSIVNPYALGFTPVVMFFSIRAGAATAISALKDQLIRNERVLWVGDLAGQYHFGFTYLAESYHDYADFLEKIGSKSERLFADKLIAPRLWLTFYNRAYLAPSIPRRYLHVGRAPCRELDSLDHKILRETSSGSFTTIRALGRTLEEPFSTVERRLERLRKHQVIAGFSNTPNLDAIGVASYRLLLRTESLNVKLRKLLHEFCLAEPRIVLLLQALGTFDFEIDLEVFDPAEVSQVTAQLLEIGRGSIRDIQVMQELEDDKFALYPFSLEAPRVARVG